MCVFKPRPKAPCTACDNHTQLSGTQTAVVLVGTVGCCACVENVVVPCGHRHPPTTIIATRMHAQPIAETPTAHMPHLRYGCTWSVRPVHRTRHMSVAASWSMSTKPVVPLKGECRTARLMPMHTVVSCDAPLFCICLLWAQP